METKTTFQAFLGKFHKIIEKAPKAAEVKEELLKLRGLSEINPDLNIRQREAMLARVDNYLNGTYGNTKREEHMGHGKPEKK